MARKETVNTFTDGLITDLNPINTPNTVLTDCLNGTLITYDGNEYSLQNDKGNYPLKDCKLQSNYIPVGVKEYGDILYIISYNPLTKHVQIGSYPSPETVFDATDYKYDNNDNNALRKTVDSIWGSISGVSANYSILKEVNQTFYGTPPEKFLLNPGDRYQIIVTEQSNSRFEALRYYILDEDKKIHDITDEVIPYIRSSWDSYGYTYVSWKVPGYFTIKMHCAEIEDFKINIRKVISPSYLGVEESALQKLELNIQTFITDSLLDVNNIVDDNSLGFLIDVTRNNDSTSIGNLTYYYSVNDIIDLNNGVKYYYKNIDVSESIYENTTINANDIIKVKVTPFLKDPSLDKTIIYDKHIKELTFNLSQKGSIDDFNIGSSIWKHTVDSNFILQFDTSGIQENSVLDSDVYLYYTITKYNGGVIVTNENGDLYEDVELSEWNINGSTSIEIPFVPFPSTQEGYSGNVNKFYAEEFYIITFIFKDGEGNILRDDIKKVVLASKLLNDYDSNRYDLIYFDQWIKRYNSFVENAIINTNSVIQYPDFTSDTPPTINNEFSSSYNKWANSKKINRYPTIISLDTYEDYLVNGFDISASVNLPSVNITCSSEVKIPTGPLWIGINSAINYKINKDVISKPIDRYTGKNNSTASQTSSSEYYRKTNHYNLYQQSPILDVFDYELHDLNRNEASVCGIGVQEFVGTSNSVVPALSITNNQNQSYNFVLRGNVPNGNDSTYFFRSYQNTAAAGILNLIDHDAGVDVLLLGIVLFTPSGDDDRIQDLAIKVKTSDFWAQGVSYIEALEGASEIASTGYFAAIKVPDTAGRYKLWLIPIIGATDDDLAKTRLSNYIGNGIKYLSRSTDEVTGAFYIAEGPIGQSDNSLHINVGGTLDTTSWYYIGQNMLSNSGRLQVMNNNIQSNLLKISPTSSDISSLPSITLNNDTNSINIDSPTIDTQLNNRLNMLDQLVQDRNTATLSDWADCANDSVYSNGNNSSSKYIATSSFYNNDLLAILNGEYVNGTPIMIAATDTVKTVSGTNNDVVYRSALYLGVVDTSITIGT